MCSSNRMGRTRVAHVTSRSGIISWLRREAWQEGHFPDCPVTIYCDLLCPAEAGAGRTSERVN